MDKTERAFHEVADIFPLMAGEEFDALVADIDQNGQLEPIWLHQDGRIIDGRNRYRACVELGIDPEFRTWNGIGSLVRFVVSLNMHRRHLSVGQKAAISLTIKHELAKEIAEEKREKGRDAANRQWGNTSNESSPLFPPDETSPEMGFHNIVKTHFEKRNAEAETAQLLGVSQGYINSAQRLEKDAPDLLEQVAVGDLKMPAAMRELRHRQVEQAPPLPIDGKYRIIYADPPWQYSNSGAIEASSGGEVFTRVEHHYPSMPLADICALGSDIKAMAENDAVLFLWATSPMLEDAFEVIKAWGFKYKTSMVWNKLRHTYGHYVSVRHELILICTKGSCTPDSKTLPNSVISIERSNKNSQKPSEVRDLIDQMYTHGNRIELFARSAPDGWDTWGNENG